MRSYVVNRRSHFKHSRRRRIKSPVRASRESTTLSSRCEQKGHFTCACLPFCARTLTHPTCRTNRIIQPVLPTPLPPQFSLLPFLLPPFFAARPSTTLRGTALALQRDMEPRT